MNTAVRDYQLDYDPKTGIYEEADNGRMPAREFEGEDGSTQRAVLIDNHNQLKSGVLTCIIEHHVQVGSDWIVNKTVKKAVATNNSFVDGDLDVVEKTEAMEEVDDLENELLDYTDRNNPISFSPKRYNKKWVMVDGYSRELDAIIENFSVSLFPYFNKVMGNQFEIEEA